MTAPDWEWRSRSATPEPSDRTAERSRLAPASQPEGIHGSCLICHHQAALKAFWLHLFVWMVFIYSRWPGWKAVVCVSKPLRRSVVIHTVPHWLNAYLEIVCVRAFVCHCAFNLEDYIHISGCVVILFWNFSRLFPEYKKKRKTKRKKKTGSKVTQLLPSWPESRLIVTLLVVCVLWMCFFRVCVCVHT